MDEVADKCFPETNHRINENKLKLIGFGADARKLYFQFSFFEESTLTYKEIVNKCKNGSRNKYSSNLAGVKFNLEVLINKLINNCWGPAAEAALLTICALKASKQNVMREIFSAKSQWEKRRMRDEWDYRASKCGLLPIMSVRYPQNKLSELSDDYVNKVMSFINKNIDSKDVVEIGSGIGRLTKSLISRASKITYVEFCEKMLKKSLSVLGQRNNVTYYQIFAQDCRPITLHDIAVCSFYMRVNSS